MTLGFTSYGYIFFTLAVALVYYLVPRGLQNIVLFAASAAFYAICDLRYLPLIALTALLCYGCALALPHIKDKRAKNAALALAIILFLAPLFACKYLAFFGDIVSSLFSLNLTLKGIAMPLGISFYTFCAIGYLVDVARGALEPCKNPLTFACFLCFFPQMSAGPIGRAGALIPQYQKARVFDRENMRYGCVRFFVGLFKKAVVADNIGMIVDTYYKTPANYSSFLITLVVMLLYGLQIYFDFAGYSDMAVGSARILGIELGENFDTPYLAGSFGGFWQRWHMSLTSWFNDYVFTGLVWSRWANRLFFGKRWQEHRPHFALNILIVFLLSGIWHGADYTFVVWGLLNGLFRVSEDAVNTLRKRRKKSRKGKKGKKPGPALRVLGILLVFVCFSFSLVFFRSGSMGEAGEVLRYLVSFKGIGFELTGLANLCLSSFSGGDVFAKLTFALTMLGLAATAALDIVQYRTGREVAERYNPLVLQRPVVRYAAYVLMYLMIIAVGVFGTSGFIYNQF